MSAGRAVSRWTTTAGWRIEGTHVHATGEDGGALTFTVQRRFGAAEERGTGRLGPQLTTVTTNDRLVRVDQVSELADALDQLGVRRGRPVVVLVGGAGGMTAGQFGLVRSLLRDLMPVLIRRGAAVVDGGTDSGVMKAIGELSTDSVALIGVAAEGSLGGTPLEPHHAHVLVPGESWGDESPWIAEVASVVSGAHPAVTLLVNGGEVTYDDAAQSIDRKRALVVLAGTGRTADTIASAAAGLVDEPRAASIAAAHFTHVVTAEDFVAVVAAKLDASD
jgi:hypothetical protein